MDRPMKRLEHSIEVEAPVSATYNQWTPRHEHRDHHGPGEESRNDEGLCPVPAEPEPCVLEQQDDMTNRRRVTDRAHAVWQHLRRWTAPRFIITNQGMGPAPWAARDVGNTEPGNTTIAENAKPLRRNPGEVVQIGGTPSDV